MRHFGPGLVELAGEWLVNTLHADFSCEFREDVRGKLLRDLLTIRLDQSFEGDRDQQRARCKMPK
jgi:hypothetical protein